MPPTRSAKHPPRARPTPDTSPSNSCQAQQDDHPRALGSSNCAKPTPQTPIKPTTRWKSQQEPPLRDLHQRPQYLMMSPAGSIKQPANPGQSPPSKKSRTANPPATPRQAPARSVPCDRFVACKAPFRTDKSLPTPPDIRPSQASDQPRPGHHQPKTFPHID